ncbi:ABC Fe+3 siderophore transporter, periplasmic substrate-binding protein [Pseudooceanicola batsensis HTCC2597]|uniref:ABC Fe+3 siderophore transporter, periplasmic substrate-binding protein n=1 Tax=Pseudooceanicola batsensis (strain ATCC BAA-863 / DSM 15984 / KCTC 12145 / HTCC2597) TaxID=252305 RepID=A3TU87_PSEBH|nr:ABC transporter substrate-binding protein [Pseudooceanicola batsensis]EAQ04083.1 ABC Fe+3 siderophore transporter, periplasmic substrate-binding protein [Pseudooceanicola batsensis HTCC2597]
MKRAFVLGFALLAAGLAPAAAETVTVATSAGPVQVESPPRTTFVYDMAALDTLDALGVSGLTSVGNTYLPYLSEYQGEAGTLFEPDFEAVHAARPDLVIVGGRSMEHHEAMQRIAPTIDMTIWGEDPVAEGLERIAAYGAIYDRTDAAAALQTRIETAIAETAAAVAGKGDALIVMTNGPKVSAYGAGSRFGWLHDAIDLPPAAADLEAATHGQAISFEFIRETDPDWLLVIDRVAAIGGSEADARATLDNPLVRDTRAWKNGRIVYLDAGPIYIAGGGARSVLTTMATIRAAFESAGPATE